MRMILWMAVMLGMSVAANAGQIVLQDAYSGTNPPGTFNPDVIGNPALFDIDLVTVTSDATARTVNVSVRMNYNNGNNLNPISIGSIIVNPGDLLFENGGNKWAMALVSHVDGNPPTTGAGGLAAGGLYSVAGFYTAEEVLNFVNANYRKTENVWGKATGSSILGSSTVNVSAHDPAGASLIVTLAYTLGAGAAQDAFLAALDDTNTIARFAAATCGNDVVSGNPQNDPSVPEPATYALMGAALLGLGIYRRNK